MNFDIIIFNPEIADCLRKYWVHIYVPSIIPVNFIDKLLIFLKRFKSLKLAKDNI